MTRDYTIVCISEAMSPITHMSGVSGNEAIVAREPVATPRGVVSIPYLSGNALRHRAVRAPGMLWLIREYGLRGRLTLPQLNFLLHGGSLTEGGGREDTRRIAEMQRLWPLLRLLGGSLPDQILAGSLHVWRGALVCAENAPYMAAVLPPAAVPAKFRPAEEFVRGYLYTRGDSAAQGLGQIRAADPESVGRRDAARAWAANGKPGGADARPPVDRGGDPDGKATLMPFAGQAVCRGAAFVHGFTLPHVSEVELGALLWSLRLWQAEGGTVGGQAARGHGRLALALIAPDFGPDAAVAAYLGHARAVRDEAVAWLDDAFAARAGRAEKAAGGRGKGKRAAEPEPAGADADG